MSGARSATTEARQFVCAFCSARTSEGPLVFVGSDVRAMFPAFVRESLLAVEFRERAYCAEQACCSDSADELTHQLDAVAASTRERASVYAYVVVTRRRSHGCVCPFDQMFPGKHVAACPLHAFEVADG